MEALLKVLSTSVGSSSSSSSNPEVEDSKGLQHHVDLLRGRSDVIGHAAQSHVRQHLPNSLGPIDSTELLNMLCAQRAQIPSLNALIALQLQGTKFHNNIAEAFIFTALLFLPYLSVAEVTSFPAEVSDVCYLLTKAACQQQCTRSILRVLRSLAIKLAPNPHCLTSVHADFLQACIAGQSYSVALRFIANLQVLDFQVAKTQITAFDVLRYFYYSGVCYLSEKNYQQAWHNFQLVITFPANALSQIVVNAIKKCKLIAVIVNRDKLSLPKSAAVVVHGYFRSGNLVYDNIAKAFLDDDFPALMAAIRASQDALEEDGNFGLAKQLLDVWRRVRLEKISKTFITLSVDRIADILHVDVDSSGDSQRKKAAVEKYLLQMLQTNSIQAAVDNTTNIVHFSDMVQESTPATTAAINMELEKAIMDCVWYSNKAHEMHKEVLSSAAYIVKSTSTGRGPSGMSGISSASPWMHAAMDVDDD